MTLGYQRLWRWLPSNGQPARAGRRGTGLREAAAVGGEGDRGRQGAALPGLVSGGMAGRGSAGAPEGRGGGRPPSEAAARLRRRPALPGGLRAQAAPRETPPGDCSVAVMGARGVNTPPSEPAALPFAPWDVAEGKLGTDISVRLPASEMPALPVACVSHGRTTPSRLDVHSA